MLINPFVINSSLFSLMQRHISTEMWQQNLINFPPCVRMTQNSHLQVEIPSIPVSSKKFGFDFDTILPLALSDPHPNPPVLKH